MTRLSRVNLRNADRVALTITIHDGGRTSISKSGISGVGVWLELVWLNDDGTEFATGEDQLRGIKKLRLFGPNKDAWEVRITDDGRIKANKHRSKGRHNDWRIAYSTHLLGDDVMFRLSEFELIKPLVIQ